MYYYSMKTIYKIFNLRLDTELKAKLETEAKKNDRSLNKEIISRVKKTLI